MSRLGAAGWTAIGRRWALYWLWAILLCIIDLLLMQTAGPEVKPNQKVGGEFS